MRQIEEEIELRKVVERAGGEEEEDDENVGAGTGEAGAEGEGSSVSSQPKRTLDDIDDDEIEKYINTAREVEIKTRLWTDINKDYLEEMQAKAEGMARTGDGRTAARKKRKRASTKGEEDAGVEAAKELLRKKVSTKINYSALEGMFTPAPGTTAEDGGEAEGRGGREVGVGGLDESTSQSGQHAMEFEDDDYGDDDEYYD
tara:strand:- start:275 stop:877 length:603 start_codon:yes stop_codon:yes gene_type:complete